MEQALPLAQNLPESSEKTEIVGLLNDVALVILLRDQTEKGATIKIEELKEIHNEDMKCWITCIVAFKMAAHNREKGFLLAKTMWAEMTTTLRERSVINNVFWGIIDHYTDGH